MIDSSNNNQAIKSKKKCWASLFFCCDPPKKEEKQSLVELNTMSAPPKQFMYKSTSHSELPNRIDLLHGIPMPGSVGFSMLHGI